MQNALRLDQKSAKPGPKQGPEPKSISYGIIIYGMLLWGVPLGLANAAVRRFIENGYTLQDYFQPGLGYEAVARVLSLAVVLGPVTGLLMRRMAERKVRTGHR